MAVGNIGLKRRLGGGWRVVLVRLLCAIGAAGVALLVHAPTHLASAAGRVFDRPEWIDRVALSTPTALATLFWVPVAVLLGALILRNWGAIVLADRPPIRRCDLYIALVPVVFGVAIRLWPLGQFPWLKPDYDEGVYLGAAWLVRGGALPYRDFVFAHLPGAIALLWPAALLITPLRDNTTALLVARAIAASSDAVTVGLIYLAARQLVAAPGALLAALIYASDALVVQFARGARLEPLQAPWLAAGGLLVLATLNGRRMGYVAGLVLAAGLTIKITGAVVLVAALAVLVLERRWSAARAVILGALFGLIALCGWSILVSGDEMVRQTVLLQLGRPADPPDGRWSFLLSDSRTALSAIGFLGGAIALGAVAWRRRVASGWLFICLWIALTLLQFAYASSFYSHYYVALVTPLAVLAAAIPSALRGVRWRWIGGAGLAGLLAPLALGQALLWPPIQMSATERQATATVIAFPPQNRVLNLIPLLNVEAGRSFVHPDGGPYILDTFLGTVYLDSPLNHRWITAFAAMRAALREADDVVTDPWTQPLPGLDRHFAAQWLVPKAMLLYTRVDQRAARVQIGPDLQMLSQPSAHYAIISGQRSVVQPIHWRATTTPSPDVTLALHLLDSNGARVAQLDVPVNANTLWKAGVVTTLDYRIPLPPNVAPGTYHLRAIIYSRSSGARMLLRRSSGDTNDTLELPAVTIGN